MGIKQYRAYKGSFSPLAGIMLAETSAGRTNSILRDRFQSPCGDYVGGNPRSGLALKHGISVFQSPCGDYVGGNPLSSRKKISTSRFSPLAGIMLAETMDFYNTYRFTNSFQSPCGDYVGGNCQTVTVTEVGRKVSVPLRGLCWRKLFEIKMLWGIGIDMFQSPCGDYVGGNNII